MNNQVVGQVNVQNTMIGIMKTRNLWWLELLLRHDCFMKADFEGVISGVKGIGRHRANLIFQTSRKLLLKYADFKMKIENWNNGEEL